MPKFAPAPFLMSVNTGPSNDLAFKFMKQCEKLCPKALDRILATSLLSAIVSVQFIESASAILVSPTIELPRNGAIALRRSLPSATPGSAKVMRKKN